MSRLYRTRWFMPAFSLFLGAVMLGAFWIGDDLGQGLRPLGVMAFVAALFFFGAPPLGDARRHRRPRPRRALGADRRPRHGAGRASCSCS